MIRLNRPLVIVDGKKVAILDGVRKLVDGLYGKGLLEILSVLATIGSFGVADENEMGRAKVAFVQDVAEVIDLSANADPRSGYPMEFDGLFISDHKPAFSSEVIWMDWALSAGGQEPDSSGK